jgi:YidC/Oxa1 family membrane protein insertase
MEKRVLIAVLLSIVVMYGYSFLVTPTPPGKMFQNKQTLQQQISATPSSPSKRVTQAPLPVTVVSEGTKDVVVESDLYTAVFSTGGATLKKLVLRKYKTSTAPNAVQIALIDEDIPERYSLQTLGNGLTIDRGAIYNASVEKVLVGKGEKKSLEFVTTTKSGDYVKKTFTFTGGSYTIGLEQQFGNFSGVKRDGVLQLVVMNRYVKDPKESSYDVHGPTTYVDNSLQTQKMGDLEKGAKSFEKNVSWSGFEDKYFLSAAIAERGSIAAVQVRLDSGYVENIISSPRLSIAQGDSGAVSYRLFFGPKELDILKAQGSRLEEVIDFGWFSAIAKPLLYALKFFYKYVQNYGVAIIIITVILKVLFYPLTNKSYKSMKEMQKLQPKMEALKEKFKNDRDAMNKAVMELYKTHKVNPMGGCLPMVVQIPVFFALYKALMFSIELRHAPFMLWINDLSAPDALFGHLPKALPFLGGYPMGPLPLLMGATMVIQQKMTPSNMDPMQAKMMMALPFIFTFMFLNFPSGLVLYWLVNNILTIAQQAYINKTLKES